MHERTFSEPEGGYEGGPTHLSEIEEKLYSRLVPELRGERVKLNSFRGIYGDGIIDADAALVARLNAKFKEESGADSEAAAAKRRGELFEAIVKDQVEASNWLGESATIIPSSEYDDLVNGVDGVVEFDDEVSRSHLALAVDVTKSERRVREKLAAIKKSIEDGTLSEVKYFKTPHFTGTLHGVPKVVVGADQHTIEGVAELLLDFKHCQTCLTRKKDELSRETREVMRQKFLDARQKLEHHPLQFHFLSEIRTQLAAFKEYAGRLGKSSDAEVYGRALAIVDNILEEKKAQLPKTLPKDAVSELILEQARRFGQT